MRRNRIFAYDLVVCHGAVNSRVALLLRSIEAKPSAPNSSQVLILELYLNSGIYLGEKGLHFRGRTLLWQGEDVRIRCSPRVSHLYYGTWALMCLGHDVCALPLRQG